MTTSKSVVMKSYNEMMQFFPYEEIRPLQRGALKKAYEYLQDDKYKFVVLELPTGSGKSACSATIVKAFKKAYCVTVQKMLQDQYMREFADRMEVLKGRNAYMCLRNSGRNCANAPCIADKSLVNGCMQKEGCLYYRQLAKVQKAQTALFNVHSFHFQTVFAHSFPSIDFMVIDEAHMLENIYMGFVELRLVESEYVIIPKANTITGVKQLMPFLVQVKERLEQQLDIIASKIVGMDVNSAQALVAIKQYEELTQTVRKLNYVIDQVHIDENNWIYQIDFDQQSRKFLLFKPIYVSSYVKDNLWTMAKKFILMSATIVDIDTYCRSLGIPRERTRFIRATSPFEAKNRLIYLNYAGSMSYRNKKDTMPCMLNRIQEVMDKYPGQRGIIHTNSFEFMWAIKKGIKSNRFVFKNGDFKKLLEEHKLKPDSIIVGPAMVEGLDLKDDLCRFQIIMKVPYPSLGDPQIKKRFQLSKSWYNYMAALKVIQAYGRGVRHKEDFADTYILDQDFRILYHTSKKLFPKYFHDAIRRIKG